MYDEQYQKSKNNKQVKLISDISFELGQAALKLINNQAALKLLINNLDKINHEHIKIELLDKLLINIAWENALEKNKTLTHIDLTDYNISDEEAKIVAKFLQDNNIVTKIDLRY